MVLCRTGAAYLPAEEVQAKYGPWQPPDEAKA
jgi:hypothetical protein